MDIRCNYHLECDVIERAEEMLSAMSYMLSCSTMTMDTLVSHKDMYWNVFFVAQAASKLSSKLNENRNSEKCGDSQ